MASISAAARAHRLGVARRLSEAAHDEREHAGQKSEYSGLAAAITITVEL